MKSCSPIAIILFIVENLDGKFICLCSNNLRIHLICSVRLDLIRCTVGGCVDLDGLVGEAIKVARNEMASYSSAQLGNKQTRPRHSEFILRHIE